MKFGTYQWQFEGAIDSMESQVVLGLFPYGPGAGIGVSEENEIDTVVVQRRCIRLTNDLKAGQTITKDDLEYLRPAPEGTLEPHYREKIIGKWHIQNLFKRRIVADQSSQASISWSS